MGSPNQTDVRSVFLFPAEARQQAAVNNRKPWQVTLKLIPETTRFQIDNRSKQKIPAFATAYMAMS
jgi:hypothetical protein